MHRARDFEDPREEDATDEEMEDDEVAESEVVFASNATEMNASPNSGSEAPENAPAQTEANDITTPEPRPRAEGLNTDIDTTNTTYTANPGRKDKRGPGSLYCSRF